MRTPLQQLLDRLNEAYESNPTHPEYREGLAEAIGLVRALLPVEEAHLKAAWRDGSEGVINQSAAQYLRETYGYHEKEA